MTQISVDEFIGKFVGYYAEELEKDVTADSVVVSKHTIKALRKMHGSMTKVETVEEVLPHGIPEVVIDNYQVFTSKNGKKKTSTNVNKGKMIAYVNQFPGGILKTEVVAKFENIFTDASSCSCSLNATVKDGFLEMSSAKPFVLYPIGKKAEAVAKTFGSVKHFNGVV